MAEAAGYPRFGDGEMGRRHEALAAAMAERDVGHAIIYGANRTGSAVGWLTRWPVTREALVVFTPGEPDLLLVNFYNHVPNAQRIATEAEVRWAGERPMETAMEALRLRGATGDRIGLIGPLGYRPHGALDGLAGEGGAALDDAYTRLRLVKSEEGAQMAADRRRAHRRGRRGTARRRGARGARARARQLVERATWAAAAPPTSTTSRPLRWTIRDSPCPRSGRPSGCCGPATC